jgi:PAS domain S-box-containing protein
MPGISAELRRIVYLLRGGDRLNGCDDEYTARSVHLALAAFLCWAGIMELSIIPLFAVRRVAAACMIMLLGGSALAALILLRQGRRRAAAALFLWVLWCVLAGYSIFSGGIHNGSGYMAVVVVLAAVWWLGIPVACILVAATLLLTLAEAVLEYTGHRLPIYFPGNPMALWLLQVGFGGLTFAVIGGFGESLRRHVSALRESEERFRTFYDASFEGILIHDCGVIVDANLTLARIFGYDHPDQLIGLNALENLLTPESRARVLDRLERRVEGLLEVTCVRKDGSVFPAETESRWLKFKGRNARLVAHRDLTERKRAEFELMHGQKMQALGQMASGVAHDFNNLLTVINGRSDFLLGMLTGQPGIQRQAAAIRKAGESAAAITDQLLAFCQKRISEPKVIDLNTVIDESRGMLRHLVPSGVDLHFDLTADPKPLLATVSGCQQVLFNLVTNARDAMPNGGLLRIRTWSKWIEGSQAPRLYVVLSVHDTGEGIEPGQIDRIFEPFFSTKKEGHGIGLGLATVYGIAKERGGWAEVESQSGVGSTFHVYFPAEVNLREHGPGDTEIRNSQGHSQMLTVLLVDDDDAVREYCGDILRLRGYSVLRAATGSEALDISRDYTNRIDLLVSDVAMPGLSGPQTARQIRLERPAIPVLFITGYAAEAIDTGPDMLVIAKPFDEARLLEAVAQLTRREPGISRETGRAMSAGGF